MKPVFTGKNQVIASAKCLWETRIDPYFLAISLRYQRRIVSGVTMPATCVQDPPAEFVTAHSESTTLGVRQAKRPRAQVFSEDPILLPEIVDQIVLVTVHPASEREDEELQRRRHSLRLLGRLDQHRPSLGRFFRTIRVQERQAGQIYCCFSCSKTLLIRARD